jgi:2-keto-4-pentenoate hydratase/2-oxohepta-3-ene-1,7-dioic acid hydratase in catechol pathway
VRLAAIAGQVGEGSCGPALPQPRIEDFLTPLQYPSKLLLGGANYYEHMFKDANKPHFRKADGVPVFSMKPPTTSLVGCGRTVRYPVQSTKLDWEIELAVVMAKSCDASRNATHWTALWDTQLRLIFRCGIGK